MELNPYSAPRAQTEQPAEPVSRKRWVAVVLALIAPPIAMLYLARPRRAIAYLLATFGCAAMGMLLGATGSVNLEMILLAISFIVPIVGAVDAYRLAGAWNRARLPWYSRAPALIGFLVGTWLGILSLRACLVEPFKMPSASMEPTLRAGDYILVHKTSYGWNVPFTMRRLVRFGTPERGDVAVFRYPLNTNLDYLKRVIGVPGDTVAYVDKRLSINGTEVPTVEIRSNPENDTQKQYRQTLDNVEHSILVNPEAPTYLPASVRDFYGKEGCKYQEAGFECKVPQGHYFVMGDNRDASSDSRYWGFVPEENFIGRAFVVWYSSRDLNRSGVKVN